MADTGADWAPGREERLTGGGGLEGGPREDEQFMRRLAAGPPMTGWGGLRLRPATVAQEGEGSGADGAASSER